MELTQRKFISMLQAAKQGLVSVKSASELAADPGKSFVATIASKNFEKYEVIVENECLQGELKLIEWRSKTEFPIVKVLFYKILQRKLLNECSVVQVAIESFPQNLQTLPRMPLFQVLYLMKESLIGFERLIDRFGPFDITSKMILINKNSKCRVWINENITLNFPGRRSKQTEHDILLNIVKLFEQKCLKSSLSNDFFHGMVRVARLVETIHFIENFTKTNKIVLPTKLNNVTESFGQFAPRKNVEKFEENLLKIPQCNNGYDSLKKIPKFVMQMKEDKRQKQIDSKSFDSPTKYKKAFDRDLSQTRFVAPKQKYNVQVDSTSKSNISPKSQISQDCKKETKSNNNDAKSGRPIVIKRLIKQNSQETLNTFASMIPRSKPFETEKYIKKEEASQQLFLTKQPNKSPGSQKCRKMSNEDLGQFKINVREPYQKGKAQQGTKISQQTATTVDEFKRKPKGEKMNRLIEKAPDLSSIKPFDNDNQVDIFEKNGWLKRVNNLVADKNFRDTLHSHYDGPETFSEDYMLSGQNLGVLGSMGKQLKGSIIRHE